MAEAGEDLATARDDAEEAVTLCCELLMWVQSRLTENDS